MVTDSLMINYARSLRPLLYPVKKKAIIIDGMYSDAPMALGALTSLNTST